MNNSSPNSRLSPLQLRDRRTLNNRVVVPAMASGTARESGFATEETISHYMRLSQSGAALIKPMKERRKKIMNYNKIKLLTIAGFISALSLTANAGGIHCDDDPMCVPCIPGVACHNSSAAATIEPTNDHLLEKLETISKLDPRLAIFLLQAEERNDDLEAIEVSVSIRLSGPVSNFYNRELLGLSNEQSRRVLLLTVTLGMLNKIQEIPEVLRVSARSQFENN